MFSVVGEAVVGAELITVETLVAGAGLAMGGMLFVGGCTIAVETLVASGGLTVVEAPLVWAGLGVS